MRRAEELPICEQEMSSFIESCLCIAGDLEKEAASLRSEATMHSFGKAAVLSSAAVERKQWAALATKSQLTSANDLKLALMKKLSDVLTVQLSMRPTN